VRVLPDARWSRRAISRCTLRGLLDCSPPPIPPDFMASLHSGLANQPTPTSAVERRFIVGIVVFFGIALLALLWMVAAQVTIQYRLTCDRPAASCTLTRRHLVGSESYQVRIPVDARAVVRVTPWKRRSAPRTFLEFVNASERTFLIEYEWSGAGDHASAAARRLNAFLAGETGTVIEEVEGSEWPAWGLLAFLITLSVASVVALRSRRSRKRATGG